MPWRQVAAPRWAGKLDGASLGAHDGRASQPGSSERTVGQARRPWRTQPCVPGAAHLDAGQGKEEEDGEAVGVERVDGRHPKLRLEEEVVHLKQQDDEGREEALRGGSKGGSRVVRGGKKHCTPLRAFLAAQMCPQAWLQVICSAPSPCPFPAPAGSAWARRRCPTQSCPRSRA